MQKYSHKELIEIGGIFALVASLVFVGIQLMQDRQIALASTYSASAEGRRSDTRSRLESDSYMALQDKLWEKGVRPSWWSEELAVTEIGSLDSGADIISAYFEARLRFLSLDESYYQYQRGLMPEAYWQGTLRNLESGLRDPFVRAVILDTIAPLQVVVREMIAEMDRDGET